MHNSVVLNPVTPEKHGCYPVVFNYTVHFFDPIFRIFCISLCFLLEPLSQAYSDDDLLAEIDGNTISVPEFIRRIDQVPPFLKATITSEESRRKALDWMIDWQLMLSDAIQKGIDKDITVEASIAVARERIIVSEYVNRQIRDRIVVPESALREYYEKNLEEFKLSDAIKISHIVVKSKKEAQQILHELEEGADFAKLARERSLDHSRKNAGQMGWLERKMMDSDFAKAAFALEKGERSGVVSTKLGYHIIRVDEKRDPEYADFEKVKTGIRERIIRNEAHEILEQLRRDLRSKAKIKINDERLGTISISDETGKGPVPERGQ